MDIYHYTRGLGTEYLHDIYPQTIWALDSSSKRALGFLFPALDGFPLPVHFVAAAFQVSEVTFPRWTREQGPRTVSEISRLSHRTD